MMKPFITNHFLLLAWVCASSPFCLAFSFGSARNPNQSISFTSWTKSPCRIQTTIQPEQQTVFSRSYHDAHSKMYASSPTEKSASNERKPFRSKLAGCFRRVFLLPIDLLGMFVAAVLSRAIKQPSVRDALGACIVSGVKQLCEDPNLDEYVDRATTTINEDMEEDAREMAVALPRIARAFFNGLIQADTLEVEVKKPGGLGK